MIYTNIDKLNLKNIITNSIIFGCNVGKSDKASDIIAHLSKYISLDNFIFAVGMYKGTTEQSVIIEADKLTPKQLELLIIQLKLKFPQESIIYKSRLIYLDEIKLENSYKFDIVIFSKKESDSDCYTKILVNDEVYNITMSNSNDHRI